MSALKFDYIPSESFINNKIFTRTSTYDAQPSNKISSKSLELFRRIDAYKKCGKTQTDRQYTPHLVGWGIIVFEKIEK